MPVINTFPIRIGTEVWSPLCRGDACSGRTPDLYGSLVASF